MQKRMSIVIGLVLIAAALAYTLRPSPAESPSSEGSHVSDARTADQVAPVRPSVKSASTPEPRRDDPPALAQPRVRLARVDGPQGEQRKQLRQEFERLTNKYQLSDSVQQRYLMAVYDLQEQRKNPIDAVQGSDSPHEWEVYSDDLFGELKQTIDDVLGPEHPARHELVMLGSRLAIARGVER